MAETKKHPKKQSDSLDRHIDTWEELLSAIIKTLDYLIAANSYKALKKILLQQFGIQVSKLYRKNLVYTSDEFEEINIYGEGTKDNHRIYVIGQSKSRFHPNDVKQFLKFLERVKRHLQANIFPLVVAHWFHPKAEEALKQHGITFFWSYEVSDR